MNATERLQARYEAALMPNYGIPPLALARGEGCRVWDADGREYTDMFAGIAVSSLGHAHPAIVNAVSRQVATLAHTSNLFLHEGEVALAERLLSLLGATGPGSTGGGSTGPGSTGPGSTGGGRVFFANSGTEANEAALKLVRRYQGPGRPVFVAAENGFHGRTMGALALTGKSSIREPFGPFGFTVRFVPYGDVAALQSGDRGTTPPPCSWSPPSARAAWSRRRPATCRPRGTPATRRARCWSRTRSRAASAAPARGSPARPTG